jgi:hypothetical protein
MTEKYIYADVEMPFHFWVREGKRWILRDAGSLQHRDTARTGAPAPKRRPQPGQSAGD